MGRYDEVNTAHISHGGNYARPFHGLALIEKTEQGKTPKDKKEFDAIRMLAIHDFGDLPPNNVVPPNLAAPTRHRIGEAFTDMVMVNNVAHAGNIASFLAGATGSSEKPTAADAELVFGSGKNPLAGTIVEVKFWNVIKKKHELAYEAKPETAESDWLFTRTAYVRPVPLEEVAALVAGAGTGEQVLPFVPELKQHLDALAD